MKKKLLLSLMLLGATSLFAGEVQQDESAMEAQTIPTPDESYLDFAKAYVYYSQSDNKTIVSSKETTSIGEMRTDSYLVLQLKSQLTDKGYNLSFVGANKNDGGFLDIEIYSVNPIADSNAIPEFSQTIKIQKTSGWTDYSGTYNVNIPNGIISTNDVYLKITASKSNSGTSASGNFKNFAMTALTNALSNDMVFDMSQYYSKTGTNIKITDSGNIDSTKNGESIIYMFTVPSNGTYNVVANWASNNDATLTMNVSTDPASFNGETAVSQSLTKTSSWTTFIPVKWKQFNLKANTVYFLRISFASTGWCGNINYLALTHWYNEVESADNLGENEIYKDGDNYTASLIALNDDIDYTLPFNVSAESAKYTRTVSADTWNALYLPFAVGNASDFASKVVKFKGVESASDNVNLVFENVDLNSELEANTIYLFEPTKEGTISAEGSNATVTALPEEAATEAFTNNGVTYTLTATYAKMTGLQSMNAYALAGDGFKKASSDDVVLKPYRAYLTVNAANPQNMPARIGIITEEETDGIADVIIESTPNANVYYNLQGMRIDNPTTGLYIKNGKKVYVK